MEIIAILFLAILSYLLGSIPSSVWLGRRFKNVDVREHGSGNAGATNTFRVLGKKLGTAVLLIDVAKGLAAVSLVHLLVKIVPSTNFSGWQSTEIVNLQILFGILAVVGHIWPVFAEFRGGKGIATLLGMVVGISWPLAVCCMGVFLLVLIITNYVAIASMLATIAYPLCAYFIFQRTELLLLGFGISAAILVVYTHRTNIKRLLVGDESKTYLFGKK